MNETHGDEFHVHLYKLIVTIKLGVFLYVRDILDEPNNRQTQVICYQQERAVALTFNNQELDICVYLIPRSTSTERHI